MSSPRKITEKNKRQHAVLMTAALTMTILMVLFWELTLSRPAAAECSLLSDRMMSDITGGEPSVYKIDTPSIGLVPDEPFSFGGDAFWGDELTTWVRQDGKKFYSYRRWGPGVNGKVTDNMCSGYFVSTFPYEDFQWKNFAYSFADRQSAQNFKNALASKTDNSILETTVVKKDPSAETFLSSDGSASEVSEVIVNTKSKVAPSFVRKYEGAVIDERVQFELTFTRPYKSHEKYESYQRTPENSTYPGSGDDGASTPPRKIYSYTPDGLRLFKWGDEYGKGQGMGKWQRYEYGAVFTETGKTGPAPCPDCPECPDGTRIIPSDTAYIKTTLSSNINIHSPRLGMAFGMAGPDADLVTGYQFHTLGYLDIKNFDLSVGGGGSPIYIYPNDELIECP